MAPTKAISPDRNTQRKRWQFRIAMTLPVWLVCETLAWVGLLLVGQGFRRECDFRDELSTQGATAKSRRETAEILHPYLGWVRRPGSRFNRGENSAAATSPSVTEFGFADDGLPLIKREPGTWIIAVTGGSLAEEFCQFGWPTLRDALQTSPEFRGRRLKIVRLALEGYKQPQQSLLLHYLLSLGAEFDFVINLDGFNEVALPDVENVPNRVFAAFPRAWHVRAMDSHDLPSLRIIGQVVHLQDCDRARAKSFAQRPWRWLPTATLVWAVGHRGIKNEEVKLHFELQAAQRDRRLGDVLGPAEKFESPEVLYRHCATIWRNSSRLMHDLCLERGIRYLHFLQPNQHLPGTKVLSPEERSLERKLNLSWPRAVEQGYPLLIKLGIELKAAGVEFHDLTLLFESNTQTTYRDDCCHLNDAGNAILAQQIADAIKSKPAQGIGNDSPQNARAKTPEFTN